MYKFLEEKIFKEFSIVSRLILGFFATLFGIVMILVAPPTDKEEFFYAFGIFFLIISVACLTKGRVRQFAGSVIGSVLFVLSGWYLASQVTNGVFFSERRSEPSVTNAWIFFLTFGIPGAAYVMKARFGWRKNETEVRNP